MTESQGSSTTFRSSGLFGPVAPGLGWAPPIRYLLRRQRVLRLLRRIPAGTLLEVGCGSGALLHDLAKAGHDAHGLETSEPARTMAIAIAQAGRGSQRLLAEPDLAWLGHFDLVCAFDVLEHISDDNQTLDEWLSWLRPGGRLCLSVPAHGHRWGAGDEWAGHYRRYNRQPLREMLQRRRLIIEHFECYGFPLANLTEVLGNRTYRRLLAARDREYAKEEASSFSGVERGDSVRLFRRLDTVAGRAALRLAMAMQAITSRTDWGSGYLVLARRP